MMISNNNSGSCFNSLKPRLRFTSSRNSMMNSRQISCHTSPTLATGSNTTTTNQGTSRHHSWVVPSSRMHGGGGQP